jgi:formylglycine-generating enzyme required for sulfatase activity
MRLPTEAEWERAAAWDGKAAHTYAWGDTIPEDRPVANLSDASGKRVLGLSLIASPGVDDRWPFSAPVGSFPAATNGLLDMTGNVQEWCYDWADDGYYATLGAGVAVDPKGPPTGTFRAVRGGAWSSDIGIRTSERVTSFKPHDRRNDLGFRCVKSD